MRAWRGSGRRKSQTAGLLAAGVLFALTASAPASAAKDATATVADGNGSMLMLLDSSGSMADGDGEGGTRIASARKAVGTVVDSLPDGYPTGLRLYGSQHQKGCTDTRLAEPVRPLDRGAIKDAVAKVRPKGDTPIGYSLQKAADDLPETSGETGGRRTIVLISDGEDNCGDPEPCEVAEELGKKGIGLRIDAIGFKVRGKAREELECVARAGNGAYYDAPDADALARQLQRAGRLSVDGYRLKGKRIEGGAESGEAAALGSRSGQYLDSIGPGEKRWYAVRMDGSRTADFAATAVPEPGSAVGELDGLHTELVEPGPPASSCDTNTENFGQSEGGVPLVSAVSRIPGRDGSTGRCDRGPGRYLLSVERVAGQSSGSGSDSASGSGSARWPLELTYTVEKGLKKGTTPAGSEPEFGEGGKDARLPQGSGKKAHGGTGFNDAARIGKGVWRDKVLPSQTLWYRVPVGWGQQLRYDVEFSNEPTADEYGSEYSFSRADTYSPHRQIIPGGISEFTTKTLYNGRPGKVSGGTVPVSWTNRFESATHVVPVHTDGDYYIAVTLGAGASRIAENPDIGVTLRVDVKGRARTGPQHGAPAAKTSPADAVSSDGKDGGGDGAAAHGAGWSGPLLVAAVAGGTGLLLLAGLAWWFVASRRGAATPAGGPGVHGTGAGAGPGGGPAPGGGDGGADMDARRGSAW
ncbi:vWA domain-containing protein [Streptomyces marispadix]|uniref:VWA domain-containing protein n=1 Tax=Streptomyces marispadix TaxID=2922868 RepID=A0ABS9SYR7_9ACTN|nr:VWA domain-containing protein [Streptomyces marispadix]MCH6161412.1 VWA domain-containing protein [Streptomyces marispadix]